MTGKHRTQILCELNSSIVSLIDGVDWQMTYNKLHHKAIVGNSKFTAEQAKASVSKARSCVSRATGTMRLSGEFGDDYDGILEILENDDMYRTVDGCYMLVGTIGTLLESIVMEFA